MTTPFWTGKEVEGRLYGIDTLCVADDFPKFYATAISFPHVLIGTRVIKMMDQLQYISWDQIRKLLDAKIYITLEVRCGDMDKIPHDMKLRCHILYWIDAPEIIELKSSDSVKICGQLHDMHVFTLFNGQRVTRNDYYHDKY